MITFTGVTKRYPDGTVAVDDLTLEVPDGCLTVFVGPSGCGKTTSMRMINRMVEPTSGVVTVDGRDVAGVDPVKLRLGIGYVIQSGGLMPHQRVIDNVATVPVLQGKSRRAARLAAYEVLERVGLDPKLGERYPAQLSGGQQQRVGVARALAADPPILLMDEPFSAVDPVVRDELQAEILRLQSELRKTIVFVTHDIDEAIKLGDAVAVFGVGGALQQYDSPSRLLSNPANDFVAEFIGADRGYRLLQFFSASTLDLRPIPTVTEGEIDGLMLAPGEWRLVTTDQGTPFGWIDAGGVERHSQGGALYDSLTAGGSLFHPDGTLRSALDAALSSPSGIGVAVDTGGVVVGGTAADDVVDAMESQRRESPGQGSQPQEAPRQESEPREAPEEAAEEQAAGEDVEPAELAVADEEPEPAESAAEEEPAQSADEEPEPAEMSAEAEADDVADADDEPELAEIVTEDEPELTADEDPQPAEKD
jgi:osmoprotectant transport system ATP-binding protein